MGTSYLFLLCFRHTYVLWIISLFQLIFINQPHGGKKKVASVASVPSVRNGIARLIKSHECALEWGVAAIAKCLEEKDVTHGSPLSPRTSSCCGDRDTWRADDQGKALLRRLAVWICGASPAAGRKIVKLIGYGKLRTASISADEQQRDCRYGFRFCPCSRRLSGRQ